VVHALLAPAFGAGLLAQLPFALVAFVVARFLYRAGVALWRAIVGDGSTKPIAVVPLVPRFRVGSIIRCRSLSARCVVGRLLVRASP
jgi:hypothetical protein